MSLLTVLIVAVSLSMDAFSLALIYGTLNVSKRIIIEMSLIVALFHFFMPLFGYIFGDTLAKFFSFDSEFFVGIIFIFLAIEMLISILKNKEIEMIEGLISIIIFAFTVSIDSFSIGVGLGVSGSKSLLSFLIFAITSGLFTLSGLILGKMLSFKFGNISTIIGSIILLMLGISNIF